MATKQVACLAASLKHGGFCYAGKDVATEAWVRPVSASPGHAISAYFRMVNPGDPARVGDVLEMRWGPHMVAGYQTENYQHVEAHWRRVGALSYEQARAAVDHPPSLWGEGRSSKHGIETISRKRKPTSLAFPCASSK